MDRKRRREENVAAAADRERVRILYHDILGAKEIELHPLSEQQAANELTRFARELWAMPRMEGYFDRGHVAALRAHQGEAQHGFATLPAGGILEILSVPTMPAEVMGFHIFSVFDVSDPQDLGRFIGYAIWSLERGHAPFGQAEAVRMAFDIFPPYRERRYLKVVFTNHDIYNASRRILYRFRPRKFVVDARTQIAQTRTGDRLKRAIYYLKRGYYPPDQKALADACLARLARRQTVGPASIRRLLRASRSPFWIYPVAEYARRVREGDDPRVAGTGLG